MRRLSDAWFEFKGINSKFMGIRLRQMPTRFLPGRNYTRQKVAGRNGSIRIGDGTFNDVQVRIECDVLNEAMLPEIWSWLSGCGSLRFSDEPNLAYDASIEKEYSRSPINSRFIGQRFVVVWTCAPFRRMVPEPLPMTFTDSTMRPFINPGTAPSLPRVEIIGSGDFALTIGDQTLIFTNVDSGIIVDSELGDALTLDGSRLANNHTNGELFQIQPGENYVTWSLGGAGEDGNDAPGNIKKVTITPRWRWI